MEECKNYNKEANQPVSTEWESLKDEVPFAGAEDMEQEKKYKTLKDLEKILQDERFMVWGHGTGRADNSAEHSIVEAIFEEGMIASGNGDGWGLSNPEARTNLRGNALPLDVEDETKLKEQLDNWGHLDSKNVILIRIPTEGQVLTTTSYEERYYPFYTEAKDENGKVQQVYLDHRLIVGCYNKERGDVEMNPYFEVEPSEDLRRQIDERKAYVENKIEERNKFFEENPLGLAQGEQEVVPEEATDNFDDSEWGNDWE